MNIQNETTKGDISTVPCKENGTVQIFNDYILMVLLTEASVHFCVSPPILVKQIRAGGNFALLSRCSVVQSLANKMQQNGTEHKSLKCEQQ